MQFIELIVHVLDNELFIFSTIADRTIIMITYTLQIYKIRRYGMIVNKTCNYHPWPVDVNNYYRSVNDLAKFNTEQNQYWT